MESDRFGLPLSTASSVAADSYGRFLDGLLASSDGAETFIAQAIAADEGFALARIGEAYLRLARGDAAGARERAIEATELGAGATPREQHQIAALAATVNGDDARGLELVEEHTSLYPLDALMVFVAQFRLSFSGRRMWKQEVAALTEAVAPVYDPNEWSILGMRAFRAEEERDLDAARPLAERSLEGNPDNARAAHVLAHTYFERAEHLEGCRFLAPWIETHHPQTVFGGHLWWHVALHQLGLADRLAALRTLRTGVASAGRSPFRVPDVASLLWRMDLYGLDAEAGDWQDASELAAELVTEPRFAFVDAHVVLAHAGARRFDRLGLFVKQLEGQASAANALVEEVVLPLARGITAFAEDRSAEAVDHLGPLVATGDLVRLGGSNAQREIFEDTLIAAMLGAGERTAAHRLIGQRLARRPSWVDSRWHESTSRR
jgi:hypothetical protein